MKSSMISFAKVMLFIRKMKRKLKPEPNWFSVFEKDEVPSILFIVAKGKLSLDPPIVRFRLTATSFSLTSKENRSKRKLARAFFYLTQSTPLKRTN